MFFMPFQVLFIWLRGLLSLALLIGGLTLLGAWWSNRYHLVAEATDSNPQNSADSADRRMTEQGEQEHDRAAPARVRRMDWHFGWNRETYYLMGGLSLTAWCLGGGWSIRWFRRRGADEPTHQRKGTEQRLRRPDGTELQVEFYGPPDAPPLVLTHGWGCDSTLWYYAKRELTKRYRLIVWDLPGLGRSTAPANNDYSLEKMAADLDAVVALAGDKPVVLVGHSIGGMILLTYCRLYPEALGQRVRGLILVHTTYTNPVRTTAMAPLYTWLQKPVLEPLCHLMIWLSPVFWLLNLLSYLNGSAHRSTDRNSFSGTETRGQLDFSTDFGPKAWPAVIARGMFGMFHYDATATLSGIRIPVLAVCGDADKICLPEASKRISESVAQGTLITLQPAKHMGMFEHHEQFHEAVDHFASKCLEETGQRSERQCI